MEIEEFKFQTPAQVKALFDAANAHQWIGFGGNTYVYMPPRFSAESEDRMLSRAFLYVAGPASAEVGPVCFRTDLKKAYHRTSGNGSKVEDWEVWDLWPPILFLDANPPGGSTVKGTVNIRFAGTPQSQTVYFDGSSWRAYGGNWQQFDFIRRNLSGLGTAGFPNRKFVFLQEGTNIMHSVNRVPSFHRYLATDDLPQGNIVAGYWGDMSIIGEGPGDGFKAEYVMSASANNRVTSNITWPSRMDCWIRNLNARPWKVRGVVSINYSQATTAGPLGLTFSISSGGSVNAPVTGAVVQGSKTIYTHTLNYDFASHPVITERFTLEITGDRALDPFDNLDWSNALEVYWETEGVLPHDVLGSDGKAGFEVRVEPSWENVPGVGVNAFQSRTDEARRLFIVPSGGFGLPNGSIVSLKILTPGFKGVVMARTPFRYDVDLEPTFTVEFGQQYPILWPTSSDTIPATEFGPISTPVPYTAPFRGIVRRWDEPTKGQTADFPGTRGPLSSWSTSHTIYAVQAHRIPNRQPRVTDPGDPALTVEIGSVSLDGTFYKIAQVTIPEGKSSAPPLFPDWPNFNLKAIHYKVVDSDPAFLTRCNLEVIIAPGGKAPLVIDPTLSLGNFGFSMSAKYVGIVRAEVFNQTVRFMENQDFPNYLTENQIIAIVG